MSGILLALPDSVERLREALAPQMERGLQSEPLILGPQDLGLVGYRALMASASGLQG